VLFRSVHGDASQPGNLSGTHTFRYTFDGQLNTGTLTITFIAGSWTDTKTKDDGSVVTNAGVASSSTAVIVTQAKSFYIELSGGLELNAAGFLDEPLISCTGQVVLEIDTARKVLTLTLQSQLKVYKLGTLGSSAGKFVLDMSDLMTKGPQFWGVMSMQTNFGFLEPYGVFIYGKGTLQINTTGSMKTESITLPGLGDNGADLTRTYQLAPYTFSIEVVGQLRIRPPGMSTDLFKMNGGFYLKIDPERFELFATAELSFGAGSAQVTYGKASGLIVIVTGLVSGENPGVAGMFSVGSSADIGLPDVNLFKASGSVSVMFNKIGRASCRERVS
jgi:hypothetical protein